MNPSHVSLLLSPLKWLPFGVTQYLHKDKSHSMHMSWYRDIGIHNLHGRWTCASTNAIWNYWVNSMVTRHNNSLDFRHVWFARSLVSSTNDRIKISISGQFQYFNHPKPILFCEVLTTIVINDVWSDETFSNLLRVKLLHQNNIFF